MLVAIGLVPAVAVVKSVAEKLGILYVYESYQPVSLPSPQHPPIPRPGRMLPSDVADNRVLWDRDAQDAHAVLSEAINTHRASIGRRARTRRTTTGYPPHSVALLPVPGAVRDAAVRPRSALSVVASMFSRVPPLWRGSPLGA